MPPLVSDFDPVCAFKLVLLLVLAVVVAVAGRKQGIKIPAVFVSKIAGEILSEHAYDSSVECCLLASSYENISWLVMIISFISLLGIIAAFVIYFLVQRTRQNRRRRGSRKCGGLSYEAVKALPTHEYKCESDGISNADTCAICLEDYTEGMKLRKLPCKHSMLKPLNPKIESLEL
jgi:E3 ubiquitin-protein ligase RNF13